MTSRDFLSLDEAMHALLSRAGVRGLAALAQQQQVRLWVFCWAWLIAARSQWWQTRCKTQWHSC